MLFDLGGEVFVELEFILLVYSDEVVELLMS